MISLAVKYRPKTFEDLTEQSSIVTILKNQVETKTFKHAYLFTGPAGTGKTTSARIFANMINGGNCMPIEIDAASNSGVDNIRTIIDDSKKRDLNSEYKIFIIDECHSLSNGAWQAMLKLLEEPPKYSVFILCTTDPQKIPATILSRVQIYQFSKISSVGIFRRLLTICDKEGINCDSSVLNYIAKISNGGMRDAITLLDKCCSLSEELTLEDVLKILGRESDADNFSLLEQIVTKNAEAIAVINKIYDEGKDLKVFINDFLKFVMDCAKYSLFHNFDSLRIPDTEENKVLMEKISQFNIYDVVDLILSIKNSIKWEDNPITVIEAMLLSFIKGDN